jgi:hypothetical protein
LSADAVLWYRLERPDGSLRRVAFFLARGRESGVFLESVGLIAVGGAPLRLWRSHQAVWLLPGGLARGGAYRVWTPATAWDEGRGRRGSLEAVGGREARRLDRRGDELVVKHWFEAGVGLVRLEVEDRGQRTWSLELVEVAPRQPADDYPRDTPERLWQSVEEAVRRLDVPGLQSLKTAELRRRTQRPAREGSSSTRHEDELQPATPGSTRVRRVLGEQLALNLQPEGDWEVDGSQARRRVRLSAGGADAVGWLRLVQEPTGAWGWSDLEVTE